MSVRHSRTALVRPAPLILALFLVIFAMSARVRADTAEPRHAESLDSDWRTAEFATGASVPPSIEAVGFDDRDWRIVDVPHNWDEYEGFRQMRHGDLHGTAWYRRTFTVPAKQNGRRTFLFFEGVGSYATIWVNGKVVGRHAGGLTTFTLDITDAVHSGSANLLAVRADHPAGIRDLPWVCGGCEQATGFSEGTQPFGIFRPVHLITTAPIRIEPFGVHVWNDADVTKASARVHVTTEIKNYGPERRTFILVTRVTAPGTASNAFAGRVTEDGASSRTKLPPTATVAEVRTNVTLEAGASITVAQEPPAIASPRLWSPGEPSLYTLESELVATSDRAANQVLDRLSTPFGIRVIHWPSSADSDGRFLVNGQPVFLNGICDYEHNLGNNHAFTAEQVRARVGEIEAAGFNAFRDAHHPHNLRYQSYWDADGILWWPQFGAHIWFDNPEFRSNFKALLRDWVKERRNSPSLVLWGLQNESVLPTDFAEQCAAIIRELDPTASSQRKITTCNGGTGVDWDVPQNWSGTYSGNPLAYADDLKRQRLVGEYGAWRSLGLHSEGGFQAKGPLSEDRMAALLETKIRLADSVRDQVCGNFLWLLTTHSNPGRIPGDHGEQLDDGIRPLDHIGPANNKGLFTIWGEPLDAYAMYRSNFTSGSVHPMVYIVSHTWPDRWTTTGRKSGIIVYSNCDEVELFNDLGERSLGRSTRGGIGTHFQWDDVPIETNVLYAEGRVGGKVVAHDLIQLHHLPDAPHFVAATHAELDPLAPLSGHNYLYRVNCGGPDYTDTDGNCWQADHDFSTGDSWGATSWASRYPSFSPRFGSQRKTYDPIAGTRDPALFQTFRYGRDDLRYRFTVPNGDYTIELYFAEPWYGDASTFGTATQASGPETDRSASLDQTVPTQSVIGFDCAGWRLFDVAINGIPALRDVDLWREAGRDRAVKKTVTAHVTDGRIEISFPRVAAGQALISAVAVSTTEPNVRAPAQPASLISDLRVAGPATPKGYTIRHDLDTGDATYRDAPGAFTALPAELLEADWIQPSATQAASSIQFRISRAATVYVAHAESTPLPEWLRNWEPTRTSLQTNATADTALPLYKRVFAAGTLVTLGANTAQGAAGAPMDLTFVVPRRPPPPAQLVRLGNHQAQALPQTPVPAATNAIRSAPLSATGNLALGREIYTDRETRITTLPATFADGDLVSTSARSNGGLGFTALGNVEVYVALDARIAERPAWLKDWISARETIATNAVDAAKFVTYRRRFTPEQTVDLGANGVLPSGRPAAMYFAVVRAVRPSVLLEAETATLSDAEIVSQIAGASGRAAVRLPAGAGHAVAWIVPIGVGDRYGLNLRYTAPTATPPVVGELTIIGADGHVLRTDKLEFPAVGAPNEWMVLRTRTGASINAGTYRFKLTLEGAAPLLIDSLEVE